METLHLDRGSLFVPQAGAKGTVLYFPGCGGSVFYRHIGLAGIALLLQAGYAVVLPKQHLCCGYPLLAAGAQDAFAENRDNNIRQLRELAKEALQSGHEIAHVLTACGSCRDGMERHFIPHVFPEVDGKKVTLSDVAWFLLEQFETQHAFPGIPAGGDKTEPLKQLLYHSPCHAEVAGMHKAKAAGIYAKALGQFFMCEATLSPGCCGESGMGAITSPALYNRIRQKKSAQLDADFLHVANDCPIVVSCPSCKMGLLRILLARHEKRRVIHVLELMAEHIFADNWPRKVRQLVRSSTPHNGVRYVDTKTVGAVMLDAAQAHDPLSDD